MHMTRLENTLRKFIGTGLSDDERQVILNSSQPPISFIHIAAEILDGYFLISSNNSSVRVIPTMVELYYHEEEGSIKDNIVYHRNNEKQPSLPIFNFGLLHNHNSGIDITFEFVGPNGICRASALIRAFRVINGITNKTFNIETPDGRSTYFQKALLGQFSIFDGYQIQWSDSEHHSSIADVFISQRIGMENRNHTEEEVKEAKRRWNFSLMMNDYFTDKVFISEWLSDKKYGYPAFYNRLVNAFSENGANYETLTKEETNDYWVRDFMPIQLSDGEFLKYKYEPDYLLGKYKSTITKCYKACSRLGLKSRETSIKMDGGNVVICGNKIVMTDKVFTENGRVKGDDDFLQELKKAFGGREIIIIPWSSPGTSDPDSSLDVYGHSDGFIKYAGNNRILMSAHHMLQAEEAKAIKSVLTNNGFDVIEMDFSQIPNEKLNFDLNWAYINFLQVGKLIFMPYFEGLAENDIAKGYIQESFPDCKILPIEMSDVVQEGGALHCLTWNIKQ